MSTPPKLYEAVAAAWKAYKQPSTAHVKAASKEILGDCLSPASAVFIAAHHLLGPGFTAWEPESLWANLTICDVNRDKLMAAITLDASTAFYTDPRVFGNIAEVLSDGSTDPDQMPCPDLNEMLWAAHEGELLTALSSTEVIEPDFDDNVETYIAACAYEQGQVLLPEILDQADPHFDRLLNAEAKELRKKAKEALAKHRQGAAGKPDDSPVGVQLGRVLDAESHCEERAELLIACLRLMKP